MEKHEKPCMEVVEIEEDLKTDPPPSCSHLDTSCPFGYNLCGVEISIGS